jgi:hypothetical protein
MRIKSGWVRFYFEEKGLFAIHRGVDGTIHTDPPVLKGKNKLNYVTFYSHVGNIFCKINKKKIKISLRALSPCLLRALKLQKEKNK